jgi:hypothetical protein
LCGSTAGLGALLSHKFRYRQISVPGALNGGLTGLVASTSPCMDIMPWHAIIIGLIAGVLYDNVSDAIRRAGIDDPIDVGSVHALGGAWSMIAAGLFSCGVSSETRKGLFYGNPKQLGYQLAELCIILAWNVTIPFIYFSLLKKYAGLRVSRNVEKKGLDAAHGVNAYPELKKVFNLIHEYTGFRELLEDPTHPALYPFHAYLSKEYAAESLDFLLSVHDFKRFYNKKNMELHTRHKRDSITANGLKTDVDVQLRFKVIYELYISIGSEKEINIPASCRNDLKIIYEGIADKANPPKISEAVFGEAELQIYRMLEQGAFRRFKHEFEDTEGSLTQDSENRGSLTDGSGEMKKKAEAWMTAGAFAMEPSVSSSKVFTESGGIFTILPDGRVAWKEAQKGKKTLVLDGSKSNDKNPARPSEMPTPVEQKHTVEMA